MLCYQFLKPLKQILCFSTHCPVKHLKQILSFALLKIQMSCIFITTGAICEFLLHFTSCEKNPFVKVSEGS